MEVHPNGVLGIAHAGVREARGRMARRMHRHPLSVVRSWTTSTGACIWKQSGRPPSPRTTEDRRTDDPHPPLYARIEACAFCPGIAHLGDALRPSSVLRIQWAAFVDVRVGWCTIGVHEPHCNTNPSALTHGCWPAWVRHSSDPTVGPPYGTGIHPGTGFEMLPGGQEPCWYLRT
jgi:hypothetical protein